jgi:hypothetical protein
MTWMFPLLSPTVREFSDYSSYENDFPYLRRERESGVLGCLLLILGLLGLEPLKAFGFTTEIPEL